MSNVRMKLTRNTGKVLLQVAAIIFLLNTMSAYGACCFAVEATDTSALPCHHDQDSDVTDTGEDCCLVCVPAACLNATDKAEATLLANNNALMVTPPISSGIDPPFRPPIYPLS